MQAAEQGAAALDQQQEAQPKPPNARLATSVNRMLEGSIAIGLVTYSGFGSTIT